MARPIYTPLSLRSDMDEGLIEVTPIYAGAGVRDIGAISSASEAVLELAAGCGV